MKKRVLSFILACFMVVSTFIITQPIAHVHAAEEETKWTMPSNWHESTTKDANGWVLPIMGQWQLLGFKDLDTATSTAADSSITIEEYRAQALKNGGHAKLPSSYLGCKTNEEAVQLTDTGTKYGAAGWYVNYTQRWGGLVFRAGDVEGSIRNVALNGKDSAVVFTAPKDGNYSFTTKIDGLIDPAKATVTATVRKNGEILATFTPAAVNDSKVLEGTVELKEGDLLMFAFQQDTEVNIAEADNCFRISNTVVELVPVVESWTMPSNWHESTTKDANGWVLPVMGQWQLLGFKDLDTATSTAADSSITIEEYRAQALKNGGHAKLPSSYLGCKTNEEAVQLTDTGTKYGAAGWYVNYTQRWGGLVFRAGDVEGSIRNVALNGKDSAVVFTAPKDGVYSFTTKIDGLIDPAKATVTATVRKNGEILATFTPTAVNDSKVLEGTVELNEGDLLMFAFQQDTEVNIAEADNCFRISNTVVTYEGKPQWTMPSNWHESTTKDANGWVLPVMGQWQLLGFKDLDTATSNLDASDISIEDYIAQALKTGGHSKLPASYLGCKTNEEAIQLTDTGTKYGAAGWYVNWTVRWQSLVFRAGDVDGSIRNVAHNGRPSAVVFTAPKDGVYSFTSIVDGLIDPAKATVTATVRKNGEVLASFTPKAVGESKTFEGTVELKEGDLLMFAFQQDTAVTIADADNCFRISNTVVTYEGKDDEPTVDPTIRGDVQLPIIFDGTSLKDKLGLVELMGYGANGLYKENMEIAVIENKWYAHDPAGKNGWSGGGPKQNYQWSGTVDGAITNIGGHNNLQDSGSALVFTAPVDGTYKFEAALSSTWFNQTTRKAWSDYIIQKYDGTTYTELVNVNNIDKPDKTVTTFEATVELKKGEQVIIIRKPNATAVTHNVSSEGTATIKITALNHICSDATVEHIEGDLQFCAPGVDDYYKCFCGALYQDADLTKEIVEAKHEWKDGVCVNCKEACKHDVTSEDATCNKAAICSICGNEAAPINPNNHTHDGVYVNTGHGTHRFNRTCCNATDIANEACTYGDDNVCDKCGYDKTALEAPITAAKDTLKAAFENEFKEGANQITVKGPASPLGSDFAPEASAVTIEGFSYDLLNARFDDEGNVFLRHHFTIPADVSVTVTVNGEAVELENVENSNLYHIDVPAVAGKYHVADEIVVSDGTNTITYKISVYTYIKVALASGTLTDSQADVVKALYDVNEAIINPVTPKAPELVAMANQTTKKIQVFDISTGNMNTPVWEYNITVGGVSGFKYRNYGTYGDVILVTVGTQAEIASCDTKEIIWKTTNTPGNSHSLDIMPNGVVAVGGTTGHCVNFYNINGEDPTKVLYSLPLKDAHAVLWDPEYKVLWVAGEANLWALDVTLNDDGTVTVKKVDDLCVEAPDKDIHDVQPYAGDKNLLLVSTHSYIYIFDKTKKEFTVLLEQESVKGVGILENGDLVYIYPDGLVELWNSTWINRLDGEGNVAKIESNQGRFYKLRIWNPNYQY